MAKLKLLSFLSQCETAVQKFEREGRKKKQGRERVMRSGAMADSHAPKRHGSDPPELRIRFLIQILGWIWSFLFLKLGPSESWSLLSDVILFVCGYLQGTKGQRKVLMAIAWYSEYVAACASHRRSS